ncbi:MAG: response regulator [Myxococcota bacterium]
MHPQRLLIADDEPAFRASLAAVLRWAGYRVTSCSPAQAMQRLLPPGGEPDRGALPIVVVDPRNRSGLELVRALCTASMDPLAVVGCCDRMVREELTMLGCKQLDKPVERSALLECVRSMLLPSRIATTRQTG